MEVKLKKVRDKAIIPVYATSEAAGADLCACIDDKVIINPGEACLIPTGIAIELPRGYAALIMARSGLASKKGLAPSNKVGIVDSDYRGEYMVSLFNHSKNIQTVEVGDRIAQLVIIPYIHVTFCETDNLSDTERGSGGFGSTGDK